jgi:predicted nucleic acid-binding protein
MIVIADTSPLNYLVLIGEAEILRRLYGRVVIPEAVLRELQHPETPAAVSEWIARRPVWLEIERTTIPPDQALRLLGEGEREAIILAQQHGARTCYCSLTKAKGAGKLSGATSASPARWVF